MVGILLAGLVAALVVARLFLFHPYNIPSSSMEPTLLRGDVFLVSLTSYGRDPISRLAKSLGFPALRNDLPRRGDLVAFHSGGSDFVKRVIGLPDDTVSMAGGRLHLNGAAVETAPEPDVRYSCPEPQSSCRFFRETLPEGRSYVVMDSVGAHSSMIRLRSWYRRGTTSYLATTGTT
ncbi:MAG: signal peptidase I [Parvibaculaceae bacterium]